MFSQCTNHQHTLPSLVIPKGYLGTSRNASQTEQTQPISFFTAVLLSQAHHTECLIAYDTVESQNTQISIKKARQKSKTVRHNLSILADFFAAT